LAEILEKRYMAKKAFITSSGMNAISTIINALFNMSGFSKPDLILYSSELYCDTPFLIMSTSKLHNVKCESFDINNQKTILSIDIQNKNVILFSEACSNPNGILFDYSIIDDLKKKCNSLITVIDNTWLSSAIHNPLSLGADYVVTSLTKYYSAGNVIAGAIISNFDDNINIMDWISWNGLHVSEPVIQIIIDNIKTLDERVKKSSDLTVKIIDYLMNTQNMTLKNKIMIRHPVINSQNKLSLYPSVFTVKLLNASKNKVIKIIKNSKIEYKTSFGSSKSRIDSYPVKLDDGMLIRLSIGYEDTYENFTKCFDEILDELNK
jgi:cystathionine beta-lyase/cystathionine gamma-synthase